MATVLTRDRGGAKPARNPGNTNSGKTAGKRGGNPKTAAGTEPSGGRKSPVQLSPIPVSIPTTALVLPSLGDVPRWITNSINDESAAYLAKALLGGGILKESDWCGSVQDSISKGLVRWTSEHLGGRKLVSFEEPTLGWVMKADLDPSMGLTSYSGDKDPNFGGFYIEGAEYGRTYYVGQMVDAINDFFDGVGDLVYVYFRSLCWFEYVEMEWAYDRAYEDFEVDCTGNETDEELEQSGRLRPDWITASVPEVFWNTYIVAPKTTRSNFDRLTQALEYIEDGIEPLTDFLARVAKILRLLTGIWKYLDSPKIRPLRTDASPGNALNLYEDQMHAAAFELAYKYPNPAEQIYMWNRDCCLNDGGSLGIAFQPFRDNDPQSMVLAAKRTGVFLRLMAAVDELLELLHTPPEEQNQVRVRCRV